MPCAWHSVRQIAILISVVAICLVECHAHGIRQARLPFLFLSWHLACRMPRVWHSTEQTAAMLVDGEDQATASEQAQGNADLRGDRLSKSPRRGSLLCRMPRAWHSTRQIATTEIKMAILLVECQSCGIRERRMPELWQFVESNAIAWHSSARIAIGLVTEGLSQPRSSLQNTVRRVCSAQRM